MIDGRTSAHYDIHIMPSNGHAAQNKRWKTGTNMFTTNVVFHHAQKMTLKTSNLLSHMSISKQGRMREKNMRMAKRQGKKLLQWSRNVKFN